MGSGSLWPPPLWPLGGLPPCGVCETLRPVPGTMPSLCSVELQGIECSVACAGPPGALRSTSLEPWAWPDKGWDQPFLVMHEDGSGVINESSRLGRCHCTEVGLASVRSLVSGPGWGPVPVQLRFLACWKLLPAPEGLLGPLLHCHARSTARHERALPWATVSNLLHTQLRETARAPEDAGQGHVVGHRAERKASRLVPLFKTDLL